MFISYQSKTERVSFYSVLLFKGTILQKDKVARPVNVVYSQINTEHFFEL